MKLFKIEDLKQATSELFTKETFDNYHMIEANVSTFSSFSISGIVNNDFFDNDNKLTDTHIPWSYIRPIFFHIIKGKQLPLSFKIVLSLPKELQESITDDSNISGLYINFKYENKELIATTGVSYNSFSLNKSSENIWDNYIHNLFKELNITAEVY